ncbi:MAG: hypothetical protein H0X37_16525 [Herpetosiphonaceae bacterium]|nr:hypothetical protein [Herpetosiphonaceae bacterium]
MVAILLIALALFSTRNLYLPLPNLLGGTGIAIRLPLLLPLAVAIIVAWGSASGDPILEAVASRPLRLLDVSYALMSACLTLLACMLVWTVGETDLALAAGRNVLGYIGLTLLGRWILGLHAAALFPAGVAIVSALFGIGAGMQPRWWA